MIFVIYVLRIINLFAWSMASNIPVDIPVDIDKSFLCGCQCQVIYNEASHNECLTYKYYLHFMYFYAKIFFK